MAHSVFTLQCALVTAVFTLFCFKCVCTGVKGDDIRCCVVVVFVDKLEFYQHSNTQRTLQFYQHLNDLNHERPGVKYSNVLRYNLNKRNTCIRYIFKCFNLYNLTSSTVGLLTSFYQSTELTERKAI